MRFDPPLTRGVLLRRYKRFFVDVRLDDGTEVVAHCPNTGSLLGCLEEGAPVLLEPAKNPERKLRWTWKMVKIGRSWVGVDTSIANQLVADALQRGAIGELGGYERVVPEVKYGREGRSRIDLLLSRGGEAQKRGKGRAALLSYAGDERVYVEVKNTTLVEPRDGRRVAAFPDAVTERGRKHLLELADVVEQGHRAAMVFSIQRSDCEVFAPADAIDPEYGKVLREVMARGVEAYALSARIGPRELRLAKRLDIVL
jgi:sugar fermentation stimulation protein A